MVQMNPLRQLRSQYGITQENLAEVGGTSQPTIAAYEAGKKSPTLETLQRLANSLGAEVSISFVPAMTREDLRSLAYHQAIVERLKKDPKSTIAKARKNLLLMKAKNPSARKLFRQWDEWLSFSLDNLISCCLDSSLLARDMRQVTPFAGLLSAQERLQVIKKFQEREKL